MRMIFTGYAINAAALCFILTLALNFSTSDEFLERLASKLFIYTYITFGPLLLIFCTYGVFEIKGLVYTCELHQISSKINLLDAFIVVGCTIFSGVITLFLTLHTAIDNA